MSGRPSGWTDWENNSSHLHMWEDLWENFVDWLGEQFLPSSSVGGFVGGESSPWLNDKFAGTKSSVVFPYQHMMVDFCQRNNVNVGVISCVQCHWGCQTNFKMYFTRLWCFIICTRSVTYSHIVNLNTSDVPPNILSSSSSNSFQRIVKLHMSMWHIDKGLNNFEIYNDIFACWDVLHINLRFDCNHKHHFQMKEVVNQFWGCVEGLLPLL